MKQLFEKILLNIFKEHNSNKSQRLGIYFAEASIYVEVQDFFSQVLWFNSDALLLPNIFKGLFILNVLVFYIHLITETIPFSFASRHSMSQGYE